MSLMDQDVVSGINLIRDARLMRNDVPYSTDTIQAIAQTLSMGVAEALKGKYRDIEINLEIRIK